MTGILPLSEASDPARAGGKAAALAALPADLDALPGVVVVPEAFDVHGVLRPAATAALLRALSGQGASAWAVRSSARGEDGLHASHAGQYATFLGVPTREVPLRCMDVLRSAGRASVAAYRAERRAPEAAGCAVLVQPMLAPDVSGIAFSADPVTGRRDVAVVAATAGLGDALAHGRTGGDLYHVDARETILRADGDVLDPDVVRRVARLARRLEAHFGRPQDVEWALAGPRLVVLQSRPITTLGAVAPERCALWESSNIAESYSGVTTPLTYSFARAAYRSVYRAWLRLLGVPAARVEAHGEVLVRLVGLVRGRLHYDLAAWYAMLALLPGYRLNRGFMEGMMGVREGLPADLAPQEEAARGAARLAEAARVVRSAGALVREAVLLPRRTARFQARVEQALDVPDLGTLPLGALAALYRRLERDLVGRWDAPLVNDFLCMIAVGITRALAARWAPEVPGLAARLITPGGGVVSAEPAARIRQMAKLLAPYPETRAMLASADAAAAEQALRRHPEAFARYEAYRARFADRCLDELKLESSTLADDPLPLLRALAAADPDAAEADVPAVGGVLREAMPRRSVRRVLLGCVARWARARVAGRENLRFERTRVFGLARRLFRAMGQRLADAGALDRADDVFYLEKDELVDFADGTATTSDLRGLVQVRRAEYGAYRHEAPPPRFRTWGAPALQQTLTPDLASEEEGGTVRTGLGAGGGVVEGVVQVVRDGRTATLTPGAILVAERTDPGWITLLAACGGVVTEGGSLLSHAAIVARELGRTACVNVEGATRWLCDGDRVRLDGRTGRVEKLAPLDRPAVARPALEVAC